MQNVFYTIFGGNSFSSHLFTRTTMYKKGLMMRDYETDFVLGQENNFCGIFYHKSWIPERIHSGRMLPEISTVNKIFQYYLVLIMIEFNNDD